MISFYPTSAQLSRRLMTKLRIFPLLEHSRHRSPVNFCVNVLCGLIAYCHQPKKPNLDLCWLLPQSA